MFVVLNWLSVGLAAVLGYVLFKRFRDTGSVGYLILLVALVLWRFIWMPLDSVVRDQLDRHIAGEDMVWPLSMLSDRMAGEVLAIVSYTNGLLGTALVIVGFVVLGRHEGRAQDQPSASPSEDRAAT